MLRELTPDDPAIDDLVGGAHRRFQRLIEEAEAKARPFYRRTLGREASIDEVIREVFAAVERDGDAAVARYVHAFDNASVDPARLRVPQADIDAAWNGCEPRLRAAMELAASRIEAYQRELLPRSFGAALDRPLGARWLPLNRVGAYVPGGAKGSLPLFSTVLMNLLPARIAGVKELVAVTPPREDGSIAPELLAAAKLAGVHEVYRVGGIPAIAAIACGTPTIRAVDKIVGPGNLFVTLAKRAAYGRVDLDMLAGPSEVLVIADGSVEAAFVAADLLSQAEHDVLAMAVCLTTEDAAAAPIQRAIATQLAALPAERRAVAEESLGRHGRLVRCRSLAEAIALSNRIAPEHLEVLVRDAKAAVDGIVNAGAIFVGPWSPEPIGDYLAGPSHTLPTGGTARMWSGIGADTFLRRSSIINLGEAEFRTLADAGLTLARGEGLEGHARSIAVRLERR